jgi:hypothetical protein
MARLSHRVSRAAVGRAGTVLDQASPLAAFTARNLRSFLVLHQAMAAPPAG